MKGKKKILAVILTALIAASVFAGCSDDVQSSQGEVPVSSSMSITDTMEYTVEDISLNVPKDWTKGTAGIYTYFYLNEDEFFMVYPTGKNLEINEEGKQSLLKGISESSSVKQYHQITAEDQKIGNIDGFRVSYSGKIDGDDSLRYNEVFIFNTATQLMEVGYSAPSNRQKEASKNFEKIASTVKIVKKEEDITPSDIGKIEYRKDVVLDDNNKISFQIGNKDGKKKGIALCSFDGKDLNREQARVVLAAMAMQDKGLSDYFVGGQSGTDSFAYIWENGELSSTNLIPEKYASTETKALDINDPFVAADQKNISSQLELNSDDITS